MKNLRGIGAILFFLIILCSIVNITFAESLTINNINSSNTNKMPVAFPPLNISSMHYSSYNQTIAACAVCTRNIMNQTENYGLIPGQAAGTNVFYSYIINNSQYIYDVKIQKTSSSPCIHLSLVSTSFCTNATVPVKIFVPLINGRYGLTNQKFYPLNLTFTANLLKGNKANFNFRVRDLTNGTDLTPEVNFSSVGSVNVRYQLKVKVTDQVEINFNSNGDANYSAVTDDPLIIPTNIPYYMPITINNIQSSALPFDAQIMIPYNALAYQQYETHGLNNSEFFYANGTLITSWLEGNILNEKQQANTLYTSANILYWVLISPGNVLFPASSSNTIYLGWAGNIPTTSNMLLTLSASGAAPQLTCSNPASTQNCSAGNGVSGIYGQYDTGPSIFSLYSNFATSVGSNLSCYIYACPNVYNGIFNIGGGSPSGSFFPLIRTTTAYALPGNTVMAYMNETKSPQSSIDSNCDQGLATFGSVYCNDFIGFDTSLSTVYQYGNKTNGVSFNSTVPISLTSSLGNFVVGEISIGSSVDTFGINYARQANTVRTNNTFSDFGFHSYYGYISLQWIRVISSPPNNTQPNVTFGPVTATPTIAITSNTPSTDVGYGILITNTVIGGTSPFTYTYNAIGLTQSGNSFTASTPGTYYVSENVLDSAGIQVASNLLTLVFNALPTISIIPSTIAIDASQSVTFTNTTSGGTKPYNFAYTVNAASGWSRTGNTITFTTAGTYNVLESVTDSLGSVAQSANQIITVATDPTISISPSTSTIDADQSVTFTNVTAGGTKPYTFTYIVGEYGVSATGNFVITGNFIQFTAAGTFNVLESVTDAFGVIAYSTNSIITTNPKLLSTSWTANSTTIKPGKTQVLTANVQGGTQPYNYNFLVYNPSGVLTFNALYSNISFTSNSFSYVQPSGSPGTWTANVFVTDSSLIASTVANTLTYGR